MKTETEQTEFTRMSDEELFDALREQVNLSRNSKVHDRKRTQAIAEEAQRRGWGLNVKRPS